LRPGPNTLALNIQGYAGAPWRAALLEYDPARPLLARWSFRPGVTPSTAEIQAQLSPGTATAPWFLRATFAYDPAKHGDGPFRLHLPSLRKGQIWLNVHNVGRYWQEAGPQESYKLPAPWLGMENELLLFDEHGANPHTAWIGTDALGVRHMVEITLR
jgi:hypothetical protein